MPSRTDLLLRYAREIRADRRANPAIAGDGTALELLLAPHMKRLVEDALAHMPAAPRILPEYARAGIGRPDLAFARPGAPARAFIELKQPANALNPAALRGHDAAQFNRFRELPLWGYCNFHTIHLYRRGELLETAVGLPAIALDPATPEATAERLVRAFDPGAFFTILETLALATAPAMRSAEEVAVTLAHAARLARQLVLDLPPAERPAPLLAVRQEFEQTLFAHAAAAGHDVDDADELFAGAFAQTIAFGLLLARQVSGEDVTRDAYRALPAGDYPLLRATLRALTQDEILDVLGAGFDVLLDTANAVSDEVLRPRAGRDPILYFYEEFLSVFDPEAREKYGVFYTPVDLVAFIVAETDRALRELGRDGLSDPSVLLLDPAAGTGTFAVGAMKAVAERAAATLGDGAVPAAVEDLSRRLHGFELLVGPYTVAHWRVMREVVARGGRAASRLPIYLTDTLAPADATPSAPVALNFFAQPLLEERRAADGVKAQAPILAILGNPPYRRLKRGEVNTLVGPWMNGLWEDLKRPVRDAGAGLSLNAFPDLYVAFWRWALWRLFEAEGAGRRGVVSFVTNRGFLAGRAFGGLRRMLRERFDRLDILDLRGDRRGARPAGIPPDDNVFAIETGICVLTAWAEGDAAPGAAKPPARVRYADIWDTGAFSARDKRDALRAFSGGAAPPWRDLPGEGMDLLKPAGFADRDWPSVAELFTFASNGIVTYRDGFAYATRRDVLADRVQSFVSMNDLDEAKALFGESAMNKVGPAKALAFEDSRMERVAYRPLDRRWLYNRERYVDRPRRELQSAWGEENLALFALEDGTGAGPAVWCHGLKPDQHAFNNRGGWVFPLRDHAGPAGHRLHPNLLPALGIALGNPPAPRDLLDAVLALLSAASYTTRFARDLEEAFPHVPLPDDPAVFARAVATGAAIRELQTFARAPEERFRTARLLGRATGVTLEALPPSRSFLEDGAGTGFVPLLADGSLRIAGVPRRVFDFAVSGYPVLHRWLKARDGDALDRAFLEEALDLVWRLTELLHRMEEADPILDAAINSPLNRAALGLPPPVRFGEGAVSTPDGPDD